MNSLELQQ